VIRETQAKHMQQRIDQCVADNPPDDEAFEYEPGMRVLALIDDRGTHFQGDTEVARPVRCQGQAARRGVPLVASSG
jgi:hypothetical protein